MDWVTRMASGTVRGSVTGVYPPIRILGSEQAYRKIERFEDREVLGDFHSSLDGFSGSSRQIRGRSPA